MRIQSQGMSSHWEERMMLAGQWIEGWINRRKYLSVKNKTWNKGGTSDKDCFLQRVVLIF
jgi:hypothetical protein